MEKNDIYEITIEDMSDEGLGIGHADGMVVFTKDTVVGDMAEIKIVKVKKNYAFGRLEKLTEPSPFRVEPECPVARQCGGCTLQHISYEKELELKKNRVMNCLKRIGGIESPENYFEEAVGMEKPERYRNKMQFPVGDRRRGGVVGKGEKDWNVFSCSTSTVLGFYAGRTHNIVPLEDCGTGHEVNSYVIRAVCKWADKYQVSIYNENTGEGLLRHVLTRVGFSTGELMICLVAANRKVPEMDKLVIMVKKELDRYNESKGFKINDENSGMSNYKRNPEYIKLKSLVLNINYENTNRILGRKTMLINGYDYISDYIDGVKFHISAESFYQVNPLQTEKLYAKAVEYAGLTGKENVWDMYSGIGTISLIMAKKAKKVYGVEIVPKAIDNARENAQINGIDNAEFFVGKAEEVVPKWVQEQTEKYESADGASGNAENLIDVVVVDPPRKGCDEKLLETIALMQPKRLVYVSCDPATLSRDIKILSEKGFKLIKYSVYDQFCRSMHVETVALIERV